MRFLIIGHAAHTWESGKLYAYRPYVREMNLWLKYVDSVIVISPLKANINKGIEACYKHQQLQHRAIPTFHFQTFLGCVKAIYAIPFTFFVILKACFKADHIHLRCPGNVGLLGLIVQFLFPKKAKTVKYAGNWDPKSKQPWSYKLQQRLLRSSLNCNLRALVYGDWKEKKQIHAFYTATYHQQETDATVQRNSDTLQLLFVGALVPGKRPELVYEFARKLKKLGKQVALHYCGEGNEAKELKLAVERSGDTWVHFHGNLGVEALKEQYQKAHYLIFPSKSEGWPKVVAEAMWWGCLPITTAVSCVPQMLDYGNRGFIITPDTDSMIEALEDGESNSDKTTEMRRQAALWSRAYTLERMESDIKAFIG